MTPKSQKGKARREYDVILRRSPDAPYKWGTNMKFDLNAVTRVIETELSETLVRDSLYRDFRNLDHADLPLMELFSAIKQRHPNVTAGLFNKVVDDMSRIGLVVVDRKTKCIIDFYSSKLVSSERWDELEKETLADLSTEGSATPKAGV